MNRDEIHKEFRETVWKLKKTRGLSQGQIVEAPMVAEAIQGTIPYGNETDLEGKIRQWMKKKPSSWPTIEVVEAMKKSFLLDQPNDPLRPRGPLNLAQERALRIKAEDAAEKAGNEIAWLRSQLEQCQKEKERLWKMVNNKE